MYFFDTYAIFEIINGNPGYARFKDEQIVTGVLNVGELYYGLLKELSKTKTDRLVAQLKPHVVEINIGIIKEAMLFRHSHRRKKMSMVDCVGYILATRHKMKFLTGDVAFLDMPNVEFAK